MFAEALVLLLPPEAGGRRRAIAPRDGSYQPFVRIDGRLARIRLFEGPPLLGPGEEGRVMLELDAADVVEGAELPLVELHEQVVGFVTVLRVFGAVA